METVENKQTFSKVAFVLTLSLIIAMAGLYLYNIIKWGNNPDFGFSFRTATGIEVVGMVREIGKEAGMQVGDRFLLVNNRPFKNISEFREALNHEMGEKNTYLMERDGRQFEIIIINAPIGFKTTFLKSGLLYLLGLCYALIGTVVFLMKPHRRTSWVFFIFTMVFGLFLIFLFKFSRLTPFYLEKFHIFIYTFTPGVFIHLALSFPEERSLLKKHPHIQFLPYIASTILFLCIGIVSATLYDAGKIWLIVVMAYMAFGSLFLIGSCIQLWLTSQSEIVKIRAKMILLGITISASMPLLDFITSTLFGLYILPGFNYYLPFFVVFPLFVAYSIVKHDLFDIDAIIKRTYGYVLTTGVIAGMYGLFVLASNRFFGSFEFYKSPLFPLVFIMVVVFLFNLIRNRVQRFIDRVFYRLEYDYQETVQKISETMRTLLGLDEIGKSIMDTVLGAMFIDSGRVMLLNRNKEAYECLTMAGERELDKDKTIVESTVPSEKVQEKGESVQIGQALPVSGEVETGETEMPGSEQKVEQGDDIQLSEFKLSADDPLVQKIAERKKEVTIYDIQEDPFFEAGRESYQKTFDQIEATLLIPLIYEDQLTGFISLGQKKSGKLYRREDIKLLNTLANQGAVAIENARLLEEVIEKERMEEELAIARDLQMSMLPGTHPEIGGFKIDAVSIQAREVGGDFYDFIEMGEEKVGLVIGDVTGKSVSGALVMSASRSVFRMLSQEDLTVGEIMIRANQRIKKDIKSGMFVALLYAVLDAKGKALSLCSAGQTQPIHLSVKTGEANLLETEGDTLPLGILEDAEYRETRLSLGTGDRVVFYTDGIVEAMDKEGEMFGFERLQELIRGSQSKTAEELLKEIIDTVNGFAAGATQHDDLTVIVLSVTETDK